MARRKKVPCKNACPRPLVVRGGHRAACGKCGSIFTHDDLLNYTAVTPGARISKE